MSGILSNVTAPFGDSESLKYIGYGAGGGYVMTMLMSMRNGGGMPSLFSNVMLESAIAGGVTDYVLMVASTPDVYSMGKGALWGALGAFVWFKYIKSMTNNLWGGSTKI
jgi:hypothetical protein